MATFINHSRFCDYVLTHSRGNEVHSFLDRSFSTVVLYGCPPNDVLVRVGVVSRWEHGFALFVQPDESPRRRRDEVLDFVHEFLLQGLQNDLLNYGIVSSFYLDDLAVLDQVAAAKEGV